MKKVLAIVLCIVMVYLGSFLVIGKSMLIKQLVDDTNTTFNTFKWTNRVVVVSNFDSLQLAGFNSYFDIENLQLTHKRVLAYEDLAYIKRKEDTYYYYLIVNDFLPLIMISECEGIEEYVATWEMKYIWFFYKWIKIEDEMTGIS